jgi:hypothetical protein
MPLPRLYTTMHRINEGNLRNSIFVDSTEASSVVNTCLLSIATAQRNQACHLANFDDANVAPVIVNVYGSEHKWYKVLTVDLSGRAICHGEKIKIWLHVAATGSGGISFSVDCGRHITTETYSGITSTAGWIYMTATVSATKSLAAADMPLLVLSVTSDSDRVITIDSVSMSEREYFPPIDAWTSASDYYRGFTDLVDSDLYQANRPWSCLSSSVIAATTQSLCYQRSARTLANQCFQSRKVTVADGDSRYRLGDYVVRVPAGSPLKLRVMLKGYWTGSGSTAATYAVYACAPHKLPIVAPADTPPDGCTLHGDTSDATARMLGRSSDILSLCCVDGTFANGETVRFIDPANGARSLVTSAASSLWGEGATDGFIDSESWTPTISTVQWMAGELLLYTITDRETEIVLKIFAETEATSPEFYLLNAFVMAKELDDDNSYVLPSKDDTQIDDDILSQEMARVIKANRHTWNRQTQIVLNDFRRGDSQCYTSRGGACLYNGVAAFSKGAKRVRCRARLSKNIKTGQRTLAYSGKSGSFTQYETLYLQRSIGGSWATASSATLIYEDVSNTTFYLDGYNGGADQVTSGSPDTTRVIGATSGATATIAGELTLLGNDALSLKVKFAIKLDTSTTDMMPVYADANVAEQVIDISSLTKICDVNFCLPIPETYWDDCGMGSPHAGVPLMVTLLAEGRIVALDAVAPMLAVHLIRCEIFQEIPSVLYDL